MNAHALLTSQGWRGTGHSLHPVSDNTGLSKPLLVSQKSNNLGLGKKQHKTSDMWWMNAFDKSLKGLDTSEQGKVVQTITSGGLDMVAKGGGKWVGSGGGLYSSFVRGEGLGGTLTPNNDEDDAERLREGAAQPAKKKQKIGHVQEETKEERQARRGAKRAARIRGSASEDTAEVEEKIETKEERRARRAAEKDLRIQHRTVEEETPRMEFDEFAVKIETTEERRARRATKKASKMQQFVNDVETQNVEVDDPSEKVETKEERQERKRQKKLLKEALQKASREPVASESKKKKTR